VRDFPEGFLWGSATAAHQVEGGNHNSDWWAWEHTEGTSAKESSGDGIDHRNRYASDFALLASLGQNAHRFSFEWARIEPAAGEFSRAALDHYARVLDSLHASGLTPFGTLHHFTLPRWFAEHGGWLAPDALDLFGRYVETVASALGDRTPWVGTVNEPQILASNGYLLGEWPPGVRDPAKARTVNQTLASAHRVAVTAVRAASPSSKVGSCLQISPVHPLRPGDEADLAVASRVKAFLVDTHLEDLRGAEDPGDFLGIQYYTRGIVDGSSATMSAQPPAGAEVSQIGQEVYPQGLGEVLRSVADLGLPVVVTENGIATLDDEQRQRYLASHLRELKSALDDGVDLLGYFHWSAFDNFEWGSFEPRFGLIGIDHDDGMRRVVRQSAVLYGEVARAGSLAPLASL
jgi:beta-glucosidase